MKAIRPPSRWRRLSSICARVTNPPYPVALRVPPGMARQSRHGSADLPSPRVVKPELTYRKVMAAAYSPELLPHTAPMRPYPPVWQSTDSLGTATLPGTSPSITTTSGRSRQCPTATHRTWTSTPKATRPAGTAAHPAHSASSAHSHTACPIRLSSLRPMSGDFERLYHSPRNAGTF